MVFFKRVKLRVSDFKETFDVVKRTTSSDFPHAICTELSILLESGALALHKRCLGKYFLSCELNCIACKKEYKFRIRWSELSVDEIDIDVQSDAKAKCEHPETPSTRPLKENQRKSIGKDLKTKSVQNIINEQIMKANDDIILTSGNMQSITAPEVLYKIRQEELASEDLDKNDFLDIYKMSIGAENQEKHFIQQVSMFPFIVMVSNQTSKNFDHYNLRKFPLTAFLR